MYTLTPAVYIWSHGYLRTIQVGIQSSHVLAELFVNYPEDSLVNEWAVKHKTLRLLNGGTGEAFINNFEKFKTICSSYDLEHAWFKEPDMYNEVTAFGLVLDSGVISHIEQERKLLKQEETDSYGNRTLIDNDPLVEFLKSCKSAD